SHHDGKSAFDRTLLLHILVCRWCRGSYEGNSGCVGFNLLSTGESCTGRLHRSCECRGGRGLGDSGILLRFHGRY
ncbi:unnamed protein product, partial [Ectocarpus fasciculatus]